ncbi:Mitochondrial inner membrane protein OXA1L [Trichinella spiralis]|uniref:Mitochondrial inner membrane protein OXA1L n=1 Tax=Trichinella spiralis TaxID=6334 RepID=A0A0V1BJ34_TRISP|nr:Mitochondrial inner membrane protein OXA1L [Trichinella spiralis]
MLLRVLFLRDCRRFSYYNNFGACFIRTCKCQPAVCFNRNLSASSVQLITPSPSALADIGPIPDPPTPPSAEQLAEMKVILGSKLEFLGLGSYSPSGLVQLMLNSIHDNFGVPWWASIFLCTTGVRLLTFPVMIYSQRNSALMSNFTEGLGKLNKNLIEARIRRDRFSEELAMLELQDYMKEHKAAQLYGRMFAISMIQGSIFLTYFLALRGMSYAPVMSMTQSGFLWITDMTLPDPAWILPLYSSLSVLIILELGLETGVSTDSMSKFKWVMRVMPIGMFFFIKDYPSVGDFLKIPPLKRSIFSRFRAKDLDATAASVEVSKKKSLKARWLEFYESNFVTLSESKIRDQDSRNFMRAGKDAAPPTFTYNPRDRFPEEFQKEKRKLRDLIDDVCTWPLDRGSCEKYSIRWFYNETTEMCVKFLYGGCQGNVNNFISRIECERRCRKFSSYSQTGDNCLLDVNPGLCKNVQLRWYFNKKKGTCESFIYGGCGGNGNNFHTEEECQNQCLNTNLCHGKVDGYYIYDESNPCTRHFYRCSNARYDAFYCLENWRFDIVNGACALSHCLKVCNAFGRGC